MESELVSRTAAHDREERIKFFQWLETELERLKPTFIGPPARFQGSAPQFPPSVKVRPLGTLTINGQKVTDAPENQGPEMSQEQIEAMKLRMHATWGPLIDVLRGNAP